MLAIELPEDIENRLTALAAATGRPAADYVREAVIEHLADLEDVLLAEHELAEVDAGRSVAVPLEDVLKHYGLAD